MGNPSRFQPGQTIVCRQLWQGKIWQVRPKIVVQDQSDLTALFLPGSGTYIKNAVRSDGSEADIRDIINLEWQIGDHLWPEIDKLRLFVPDSWYSVILFRNTKDKQPIIWYINIEEPVYRTSFGFEYVDLFLDIIVDFDLKKWRWVDEDELEAIVNAGYLTQKQSDFLYEEGTKAVEWLRTGYSPFTDWIDWQPDPSWQTPVLPDNWSNSPQPSDNSPK